MRKQLLLMLILCLSATMVWAERIDVSTARKVAENVANAGSGLRSAGDLSLVYAAAPGKSSSALRSGTVDGAADYFVFNVPGNKGFVIVSGDDRAYPVLGQSDEGSFDPDNLPENLRAMLAYYQDQVTWAERINLDITPNIQAEWSRYLNNGLRASGENVLLPGIANWGQDEPFNLLTPIFDVRYSDGTIGSEHAPTGCVATAWGIVMKYYGYPKDEITNPNRITMYGKNVQDDNKQPVLYGSYNWDNILSDYKNGYGEEQANAVASLMWQIGANVEMTYGSSGSGAISGVAAQKMINIFGFSKEVNYLYKEDYRWKEWKDLLRTELREGRPVIYDGTNKSGGGHAFICDGFKENEAFHIN